MNGNMASNNTTMMSVMVLAALLARMAAVRVGPFMMYRLYLTRTIGDWRCICRVLTPLYLRDKGQLGDK